MIKNKTYIVYPHGALSWEEILETVELLKTERANPKIVKHNGFWNVQAQRKEEVSEYDGHDKIQSMGHAE